MGLFIGSNRLLDRLRTIRDIALDIQKNTINQLSNRITQIEYNI